MSSVTHLDFETFSELDLRKVGAYRYAEHHSTEVMICCYAIGEGPVKTWLPWKEPMPLDLYRAALDDDTLFAAHNAEFERQIWRNVIVPRRRVKGARRPPPVPLRRWRCTAAQAAAAGLPRGLDGATKALGLPDRKDAKGKRLITFFCMPRKTKNGPVRRKPEDHPERFAEFIQYCRQDVRSERGLEMFAPPLPPAEVRVYHHNCVINDRGVPIDVPSVQRTLAVVQALTKEMEDECRHITGVNATQRDKFLHWLHSQGLVLDKLGAKDVETALARRGLAKTVRRALELRSELGKAAPKKLSSMLAVVGDKDRARGTLLYHGAHTGRLSGRLIQPHNFKRGLLKPDPYHVVLQAFRTGDAELVKIIYGKQALDLLSQVMRGFIRAPEGYELLVADYSAIEARLLAWAAGELAWLDRFRNGEDTYKAMAAILYRVAFEDVTDEQRRIGKQLVLGAGYQLGAPKFVDYCLANGIEITLDFAEEAIGSYRDSHAATVRWWGSMQDAAIQTVLTGRPHTSRGFSFEMAYHKKWLLMHLPSGRKLHYYQPQVENVVKFRKVRPQLSYFGKTKKGGYGRVTTYGGKLVENAIQAAARDILVGGMENADKAGMPVVLNVHDEIISVVRRRDNDRRRAEDLCREISRLPRWAHGLPLRAAGFECEFYRKG